MHAETMAETPKELVDVLKERWDWQWRQGLSEDWEHALVDSKRLPHLPGNDPLVALYEIGYPELSLVLSRLQEAADLPFKSLTGSRKRDPREQKGSKPELSVVIPTHNPCHWLLEAIASVERHQGNCNVELLIVNDGSTKRDSIELLNKLEERGYRVIHKRNGGLSSARNLGFAEAQAELVLPLDDDNRLLAPYFSEGVALVNANPQVAFVYGERLDFGARTQRFKPGPVSMRQLQQTNRVDACAIIRKGLWKEVGGYDESMKALEDWDFWLSAAARGLSAGYIQKPCFEYRVRENSMLQKHLSSPQEHHSLVKRMQEKHGFAIQPLVRDERKAS
jgi:hypothetical protein